MRREKEKREYRMGLLSNRKEKTEIKAGDHIYTWRAAYAYSHHGKTIHGNLIFSYLSILISKFLDLIGIIFFRLEVRVFLLLTSSAVTRFLSAVRRMQDLLNLVRKSDSFVSSVMLSLFFICPPDQLLCLLENDISLSDREEVLMVLCLIVTRHE